MKIEILIDGQAVVKADADTPLLWSLMTSALQINLAGTSYGSYPATREQMADLLSRVDPRSGKFLRAIASNADGHITWKQMKEIFDVKYWAEFSGSYGKGITRALRNIVVDKKARLFLWDDENWDNDDDNSPDNIVYVDGPALYALQHATGVIAN